MDFFFQIRLLEDIDCGNSLEVISVDEVPESARDDKFPATMA